MLMPQLLGRLAFSTTLFVAALVPALSISGPSQAVPMPIDLELILAVDVSGSVDAIEARMQREGYIAAMTSDKVVKATKYGPYRRIALAYVE